MISSTEAGSAAVAKSYHVFTTDFDVGVRANRLDSVLGPLSTDDEQVLDQAWHALQTGLLPWKTRLLILAAEAAGGSGADWKN